MEKTIYMPPVIGLHSNSSDSAQSKFITAVGSYLALHKFTLQTSKNADIGKDITVLPDPSIDTAEWARGKVYAEAQILAREVN